MYSARHETDSARLALNVEALALTTSFLSPLVGPFAFIPAIFFGHVARSFWKRSGFDHQGGPTLLALVVGYSFAVSALCTPFATCVYSLAYGESLSLIPMMAAYWMIGAAGVSVSFFAYLVAIESRTLINISVILILVAFGLCMTSISLVQARKSARQIRTMNNLREIGLGIQATMEMDPNGEGRRRQQLEEN